MDKRERPVAPTEIPDGAGISGKVGAVRDVVLLGLLGRFFGSKIDGRMTLTLPSGVSRTLGRSGQNSDIQLKTFSVVWHAFRRGSLGFAQAYLDGEVTTTNLGNVFRFFVRNRRGLERLGFGLFRVRRRDLAYHQQRANTREGSRRNIAAHYDLGNDFYALWLDSTMTYSSGLYADPDATLEDAQRNKYREVIAALDLLEGDRVLEIGCGWGGFAEAAARSGARVDAITLSERQFHYAVQRIQEGQLAHRADIQLRDYRDTSGQYDKIASIEMVEAVGEDHWPAYFRTLFERLKPGGIAAIQAITIREASFPDYRRKADFIQRYVFPGGMLPTKTVLREQAAAVGLRMEAWREFGDSYARTLAAWRKRFHEQWPHISALGFDERFRRLWDYYLTYCEVGFEQKVIGVGIYRFHRPVTVVA